jgi:hypothetical protein
MGEEQTKGRVMPFGASAVAGLTWNLAAVGTLTVGAILGQLTGTNGTAVEYGALGLAAFMVVQNYRIQVGMGKALEDSRRKFADLAVDIQKSLDRNSRAMEACINRQKEN